MAGLMVLSAQPKNCNLTPSSREKKRKEIEDQVKKYLADGKKITPLPSYLKTEVTNEKALLT